MRTKLRRIDPTQPRGAFVRRYSSMATRRITRALSRLVGWKIDPLLLRLTRGRVATTLVFPTAVLETKGVKTGKRRRNAVIYALDGNVVTIVASNAGSARHPAWYHNLCAHPRVTFAGVPMTASIVEDDSTRERLAALTDHIFPGFETYRREAASHGRTVPIVQLRGEEHQ